MLALVAQPLYGFVTEQVANAAAGDPVCVQSNGECYTSFQDAVNAAVTGDVITLQSNVTVTSQVTVAKTLAIEGNNRTVSGSFARVDNSNNSIISPQGASNTVTIKNLTVNAAGSTDLHGVNVYRATAVLDNVTIRNTSGGWDLTYGLMVNGASVTATGVLTTTGNDNGVNVDQAGTFIMNGQHVHSGGFAIVRQNGTVSGITSQYDTVSGFGRTGYTLKTAPATPAIIAPSEGENVSTPSGSVTISWNSVANAHTYLVSVGGATVPVSGTSYTTTLSAGVHTVTVRSVAESGLLGGTSSVRSFTVTIPDTTPPAFSITTPSDGSRIKTRVSASQNTLKVNGTFTDPSGGYVELQLVGYGFAPVITTHAPVNEGELAAFDTTGFPDGEYKLYARATDYLGNALPQQERTIYVDNTAPNAPNNLRAQVRSTGNFVGLNGWTNRPDVTALWNSNNTEVVTYEYQYWNDVATSHYNSGNRWLTNRTTTLYPGTVNQGEGKHYFCVIAIDLAGNRSNCSTPFSYNYDATKPVTDINVSPVADGKFTVSGSAADNLSLNRVYAQLVNRQTGLRYGGKTVHLIGSGQTANWSVEYAIADLPQGDYAAHVEVTDMAGNRGSAGWTSNFFVDRTAPDVQILNMATLNPTSFDIKATDTVGLKRIDYSLWTNGNTTQLGVWGDWIAGTEFTNSGISQYTSNVDGLKKNFANLPDGEYTLRATAGDAAGNSKNAENFDFTVDRTAPNVTVNTIPVSTDTTPTITGTVGADAVLVEVSLDNGATWQEATIDGTAWTLTVTSPLATGLLHTVIARATDAAGNVSDISTSQIAPYWTTFTINPTVAGGSEPAAVPVPVGTGDTQSIIFLPATFGGLGINDGAAATPLPATPITESNDDADVLGAEDTKNEWSLGNAILTGITALLGLIALIGLARRKDDGENNHALVRVLTLVPLAAAVIAFFVIEDLSASMVWFNGWTLLFALVAVVQIVLFFASRRTTESQ